MWICSSCGTDGEDGFDLCWNCGRDRAGRRPMDPPPSEALRCDRCHVELTFAGTRAFHEGVQWGVFGNLGELFENRERFDVYFCARCGKVELFVVGIGEERRPRT